jgi:short-subunit dehydrogenase
LGDLDAELAAKSAAELGARPGAVVVGLPLNVGDRASFAQFLDEVEAELGPIDVLVNNAGIMPTGLYLDEGDAMTERMLDVNVRGVLIGSKLAGKRFADRGAGSIVNVASLAGAIGEPGLATYCGTKHFVVGFTEALHQELSEAGVGVTAVMPGIVRTELSAGATVPRWLEGATTVDPSDVAAAIVKAAAGGRIRVTVPKALSGLIRGGRILPERAQLALGRFTKLDRAFTEADPKLREAYHRRLAGDQ